MQAPEKLEQVNHSHLGGYALLEARRRGTPFAGTTAGLRPRHTFSLWVKHRLERSFRVGAGRRAESARFASPANLTVLPGYDLINVGTGHESGKFDVTLTLKNLLDRKCFVSAHSGANDYNMPGEPRSLLVAARYRY